MQNATVVEVRKIEDSQLRAESSTSQQSFDDDSSVLYDNESPEAFNILESPAADFEKMSTVMSVHNVKVVRRVAGSMM
ncbi:hypothetical protein KIN20_014270 [Parelaphostrongylus tenuis]|uniref:Uncharacterized protein n=1 Tax=Parelaphostrongylus tenuis TaxID=148309 RepID=A0AAD5MZ93_PARTN|nr:hypothetical protein KIN20_014270 [Parelaphostrongylus tenuis]